MATANAVIVQCTHVGEFIEEASASTIPAGAGEPVRPSVVFEFIEEGVPLEPALKTFTVLLRDSRVVTVRGHRLSHVEHPHAGSYGVMLRSAAGEELVALFRVDEVTGIFSGQMQPGAEKLNGA